MQDILIRLRADAGQLTLGVFFQEREAAAWEIEQLRGQLRQRIAAEPVPRVNRPAKAVVRPNRRRSREPFPRMLCCV